MKKLLLVFIAAVTLFSCKKGTEAQQQQTIQPFNFNALQVDGKNTTTYTGLGTRPALKFIFSVPVKQTSVNGAILFTESTGAPVAFNAVLSNNDSAVVIQPASPLQYITKYTVSISTALQSNQGNTLSSAITRAFVTAIDSTDKFPRISDSALLDLVQKQTLAYFTDGAHPVSAMARERNTSGDVVTTGGTGFGIMAMLAGIKRNFISRTEALGKISTIVSFLTNKATTYHGAFAHWINGATGATIPFSTQDDGADLVETAYLMQGLLCARQFFNSTTDATEINIRNAINNLWNNVQWNWFTQNGQNTLYWHWSPAYAWSTNQQVSGWNEALITYVLSASSPNYAITKPVYDNGWARNGAIKNGNTYFGVQLPLGPAYGGPLFFAHYSFLGIDPTSLTDAYANYRTQDSAHTLINYNYCIANPKNYYGYSDQCWGLTASDDNINGYLAHEPNNNDDGVISPTAALSSFPYTPNQSMKALKFFYYKLGDRIWKTYGFVDAFNLEDAWFAGSFLAIDQAPVIVMMENYRSGLLWNLFMSCPEIKTGMHNLGFQSPNL